MVINATENLTKILSVEEIQKKYTKLYWGGNGVGDRWANKIFNYTLIYANHTTKLHSEYNDDLIPKIVFNEFLSNRNNIKTKSKKVIGIYAHSIRKNKVNITINKSIRKEIVKLSCIVCGTSKTICDHKNDFYNDDRVLNPKLQTTDDFQPLCEHCKFRKPKKNKKNYTLQKIY
jgi:hypothetical protein